MKAHIHLNGRLGKDPEIREVGEHKVATLSLAVSEKWKAKDGSTKEHTSWFRAEMWNAQATIAQKYLHKGDVVGIHGTMREEKYTDKDNQERRLMKIRVTDMDLLPNKARASNEGGGGGAGGGGGGGTGGFGDIEEDIPF